MFWKHVNSRRLSLLNRLMFLYGISTLASVLVIGLFFYPLIHELIYQAHYQNLTTKCGLIVLLLTSSASTAIASYWVARKGLKKLEKLTSAINGIQMGSLSARTVPNEYPHELKMLSQSFNHMLDRIEAGFLKLSQFSSDIAHELRTPLHNLINSTELILAKPRSTFEYRELIESHLEEYQHLAKLVRQLLFLARTDNGQVALNKVLIPIHEQIASLLEYYQFSIEEKQILLSTTGTAHCAVDLTLFRQLLNNLISNAIRFSPEHALLQIGIRTEEQGVIIEIENSGAHIPAEHLDRIFERFYRPDLSRTQDAGGLGLGLAIAKSIVDLHQGHISIQNSSKQTVKVTLALPHDHH